MWVGCGSVKCRRAAAVLALAGLLLTASAAQAQRLLTLVPGVGAASSTDDPGPTIGPLPTAVQVDLELLRGDPSWLEVPTPDGDVLSAERSVFEDRGDGDLMWSGGQPGAGYDTVVLTVEGGRLVGRFAAAGGGAYRIHANRAGRGGIAPIAAPDPDSPVPLCAVHEDAEEVDHAAAHVAAGAHAMAPPRRVSNPQSHDRLDILVAYTATAAENWAAMGGPHAAIRHAGDYLKMVFRNNRIEVVPHIVHTAQAPAAFDRAARDGSGDVFAGYGDPSRAHFLADVRIVDADLLHLRHEHRADVVYLFTGEPASLLYACGGAAGLSKGVTAREVQATGWSTNHPHGCPDYAVVFVHEIGHVLGADHDPANVSAPDYLFRAYATGHADYDVMPSVGTAMSYRGQVEPFFSTPRIRPWGAVLGIADEQDNERLLQETVHIGVQFSDYLRSLEGAPAPPTDLRISYEGGSLHLSWRDNAPDADGYELESDGEFLMLEGRTEATVTGDIVVQNAQYMVRATKNGVRSLRSNIVYLTIPDGPIAAPSGVSVTVNAALGSPEIRWTDNSTNEEVFDVQLLLDGEPVERHGVPADSERSEFGRWGGKFPGRDVYGARVFACSYYVCSESSETVTFRWDHPLNGQPPADLSASPIGPTTIRVAWRAEPPMSYDVYASLRGWLHSREWDGSRDARGRAHVDFENLARGGRYRFEVIPSGPGGEATRSRVYLTLGARGEGPRAPSNVAFVSEGRRTFVSWKDNSSDEMGFEVQEKLKHHRYSWRRLVTVPADVESVAYDELAFWAGGHDFRVFAFNERGYSVSSELGVEQPLRRPKAAFEFDTPCDEQFCRTFSGRPVSLVDTSHGIVEERRWNFGDGATSTLRSPTHSWSSPGRYTVTLTVSNRRGQDSVTRHVLVAPTRVPGPCRADGETLCLQGSRFEVKAHWRQADGASGAGLVVPEGTGDSGLFRFFDSSNWEVLIKVLDGCSNNGHVWVLGASTTDLGYVITVTDTTTEKSRTYTNEPGRPAPAIVDTDAFSAPCVVDAAAR